MTRGIRLTIGFATSLAPFLLVGQAMAQAVPGPSMNIPEASSKPGFDWGISTGVDYVSDAKCSLQNRSVYCSSAGTTAFAIPTAVMAQYDRLRLEVTVPFVDIEGPGTVSGVLGVPQIQAASTGPVERRSGLGDVSVGGAFIVVPEGPVIPRLEVAGVVKLPTGANGLGTGKTDYGAQATFYRPLFTGLTTFGSVGYQWVGDPNTVDLHSGARATAGADLDYGALGGGALLAYQQKLAFVAPESFTIEPYVTLRFIGRVGVSVYTIIGLTKSSPDHGVGVRLVL
jgi:hypothetical protein